MLGCFFGVRNQTRPTVAMQALAVRRTNCADMAVSRRVRAECSVHHLSLRDDDEGTLPALT